MTDPERSSRADSLASLRGGGAVLVAIVMRGLARAHRVGRLGFGRLGTFTMRGMLTAMNQRTVLSASGVLDQRVVAQHKRLRCKAQGRDQGLQAGGNA